MVPGDNGQSGRGAEDELRDQFGEVGSTDVSAAYPQIESFEEEFEYARPSEAIDEESEDSNAESAISQAGRFEPFDDFPEMEMPSFDAADSELDSFGGMIAGVDPGEVVHSATNPEADMDMEFHEAVGALMDEPSEDYGSSISETPISQHGYHGEIEGNRFVPPAMG